MTRFVSFKMVFDCRKNNIKWNKLEITKNHYLFLCFIFSFYDILGDINSQRNDDASQLILIEQ